ncbi:MAG: SDR family NAD(P)-dependent oxidoreductase [Nitrososphaeraceae archaeon]
MYKNAFRDKKILITGGTGSLGQALTKLLLKTGVNTIRIFSRNERQQIMMEESLKDDRLRFFIGDVRDLPRLTRAMEDIDVVFHAAALKHVPIVEYNPFEGIKTNVIGSQNVIEACLEADVEIAVGIGTDKSVAPLNTYCATKLLMEKMFVTANNYLNPEKHRTKFIALRYGNVLGSSGSVVPKFIRQIRNKEKVTITDPNMTRFSITMDEALDFIVKSTLAGRGSEIFVPKLRAYIITDLKDAIVDLLEDTGEEKIPIRAGEKNHETLINSDEMRNTYESDSTYVILNPLLDEEVIRRRYSAMKKVDTTKSYSSDLVEKIPKEELKQIIVKAGLI